MLSRFGHGCFVLGLVTGSNLHSHFNLRLLPAITCQLTADSLMLNDSLLACRMSLHHGLTDLCDNHLLDYSGIFPGRLEILSGAQTYFEASAQHVIASWPGGSA